MFYKLGRAGGAAGEVRRGRLRHHDRPRRARRAAHRQGLRGRRPAPDRKPAARPHRPTTPSCSTRRRPAAWSASSTSTPRSPTSPRWARSAPRPTRSRAMLRSRTTAVHVVTLLEEMPVQETVDAIARAAQAAGCRSAAVVVNQVREPLLDGGRLEAVAADARPAGARRHRRPRGRRGARQRRPWSPGCWPRRRDHADRVAPRAGAGGDPRRRSADTVYRLPLLAEGTEAGGIRVLADAAHRAGDGLMAARSSRPAPPPAPPLDVDDPAATTRRPGSSSAAAPAASARPPPPPRSGCARPRPGRKRRRAHHRPGAAAGPVAGPRPSSTTPRGRWPASTPRPAAALDAMMLDMKRTFDEVVEAHSTPDKAAADPGQPLLPGASPARSRARRSTWRWRSSASCAPRPTASGTLGPDRRRHPAVPVGAGLPRRPQAARLVPRRPVHPAAHGPGQGRRPGLPQGVQRRASRWSTTVLTKVLGGQLLQDVQTFVAALDTMFGGFRERADQTYALLKDAEHGVRRRRRARAGRAARGVLLRRPARRGGDAAGRPGRQPDAAAGRPGAERVTGAGGRRAARRRRRRARSATRRDDGGAAAPARRPGGGGRAAGGSWPGGSPPATPAYRWWRCRPRPRTSTTSRGCARWAGR